MLMFQTQVFIQLWEELLRSAVVFDADKYEVQRSMAYKSIFSL